MGNATRDLNGKRAVVTGAASGIGLGIARRMAEAGASVIATDIDARRLDDQLSRGSYGPAATAHPLDVADIAAVQAVFARIAQDGASTSSSTTPVSPRGPIFWRPRRRLGTE